MEYLNSQILNFLTDYGETLILLCTNVLCLHSKFQILILVLFQILKNCKFHASITMKPDSMIFVNHKIKKFVSINCETKQGQHET